MSFLIRTATREDAEMIADVSHQTFYDAFIADNRPEDMEKFLTQQFTKGKLILEVGSSECTFLLAYQGEELAGYVKLRDARVPRSVGSIRALEIARLYALTEWIGKGAGKVLMQASIDQAQAMGKDTVWLGVWEKNQRAIDFYTKWGFEKFDENDFLLGDDLQRDWLMKKKI